jgi:hypothetical protein
MLDKTVFLAILRIGRIRRNLNLVPEEGVEPTRPCGQRILSPPRLPFRHSGRDKQK